MTLTTIGLAALLTISVADAKGPGAKGSSANERSVRGHELSLELGTLGAPDSAWRYLGSSSYIPSYGARVGFGITPAIAVVASWHRGQDGAEIEGPGATDDDVLFRTAFTSHQIAVGPKLQWRWKPWLAPYATLQGLGVVGRARLDDGFDEDDNPNQYTYRGFAPGGMVTGGVDLKPVRVAKGVRLGTHLEMGYALTSRMTLVQEGGKDPANSSNNGDVELGSVGFRGFTMRFGVGVNF